LVLLYFEFWTKCMKRGVIHGICGNGVELGIWGLSGVYAMPMQCGKLCKLIWYDRNFVWYVLVCELIKVGVSRVRDQWRSLHFSLRRAWQRRIPYCHTSVSLRRRGWVLSDTDSRSGKGGSPKWDSEEVARVEHDFSSRRGFCGFWANQGLAQARWPRLSEMLWPWETFCLHFSPGEI